MAEGPGRIPDYRPWAGPGPPASASGQSQPDPSPAPNVGPNKNHQNDLKRVQNRRFGLNIAPVNPTAISDLLRQVLGQKVRKHVKKWQGDGLGQSKVVGTENGVKARPGGLSALEEII